MTTKRFTPIGDASRAVALHVYSNRRARGWSQEELAKRISSSGFHMTLGIVGKIEANLDELDRRQRRVTVDELVAFAAAFGANPGAMLTAPECGTCNGAPPAGFTCQTCGRGNQ